MPCCAGAGVDRVVVSLEDERLGQGIGVRGLGMMGKVMCVLYAKSF